MYDRIHTHVHYRKKTLSDFTHVIPLKRVQNVGCILFPVWGTFPCFLLHFGTKTCTLLIFGTKNCHLHCSSIVEAQPCWI